MAAITYRLVKGSRLTIAEGDDNIHNLDDRMTVVEAAIPVAAVGIASIARSGGNLIFTFTDASTTTVSIPATTWNFRGAWAATTVYAVNDVFYINGGLYIVIFAHTSAGSFDPAANDGLGDDYYSLLFSNPALTLPTGGATGTKLKKNSGTDFDMFWGFDALDDLSDVAIGTDLASGDVLQFDGFNWVNSPVSFSFDALTGLAFGTDLAAGDVLQYDGSDWVNHQLTYSDISGTPVLSLDNLTDVIIGSTALAAGDVLKYDGTHWIDAPLAFSEISGTVADSQLLEIKVQTVVQSGGNLAINRSGGEIVKVSVTANITAITITGWPAANILGKVTIQFTNTGAFTVAGYPVDKWSGNSGEPTLTSGSGKIDRVMISTIDGGTTKLGDVIGQDYA